MAFSEETVKEAWGRSEGRCHCRRTAHAHGAKCNKLLIWSSKGREGWGGWEANHTGNPDDDSLSNCEIICWNCHWETF